MIRRNLDSIIEEFYKTSKNALFLTGARQVGKSYAIRKFATANFPVHLELNFYKDKDLSRNRKRSTSKNRPAYSYAT